MKGIGPTPMPLKIHLVSPKIGLARAIELTDLTRGHHAYVTDSCQPDSNQIKPTFLTKIGVDHLFQRLVEQSKALAGLFQPAPSHSVRKL